MPVSEATPEKKRRVRYSGTHPRHFEEKYKELNPDKYAGDVQKVIERGQTPAGMHRSICVQEILEVLDPKPGETGLDATLGFGGHTEALLSRIVPDGRLFGIDVDALELPRTEKRLRQLGFDEKVLIVRKLNFAGILKLLPEAGSGFDFILADLGVSSMQIDNPARGFTFKADGPLDLRLNPERGQPAAALLQTLSESALEKILRNNSDEPYAKEIAKKIFKYRDKIATTTALANTIREALEPLNVDNWDKVLTKTMQRTFQALRIEVNGEFSALEQFLLALPFALKPRGRVAILTFHSGEDNRVKKSFEDGFNAGVYSDYCKFPIRATAQERYDNPRSKSAQLRWAVRSDAI
jgi:16S rRNA (cytosine1402-N4)-methyltransferase